MWAGLGRSGVGSGAISEDVSLDGMVVGGGVVSGIELDVRLLMLFTGREIDRKSLYLQCKRSMNGCGQSSCVAIVVVTSAWREMLQISGLSNSCSSLCLGVNYLARSERPEAERISTVNVVLWLLEYPSMMSTWAFFCTMFRGVEIIFWCNLYQFVINGHDLVYTQSGPDILANILYVQPEEHLFAEFKHHDTKRRYWMRMGLNELNIILMKLTSMLVNVA